MALMAPLTSDLNFTPTSTPASGPVSTTVGTLLGSNRVLGLEAAAAAVASSSTARKRLRQERVAVLTTVSYAATEALGIELAGGALQHLGEERDLALLGRVGIHELDAVVVPVAGPVADHPLQPQGKTVERHGQLHFHLVANIQLDAGVQSQAALVQLGPAAFGDAGVVAGLKHQADGNVEVETLPAAVGGGGHIVNSWNG